MMEIGPVIAASVFQFLHSEFGVETIGDLKAAGVDMTAQRNRTRLSRQQRPRSLARRWSSPARSPNSAAMKSKR